ncbi:nitroreductase family protein [Halanaerobium sp. MA284_MarDTE_T2]|uniref:nitroreductase family protein n=1 Tax=Halanaerobium sp. MA284_MarDTE_T2 TaxID=2183913 RepID=UPI000DF49CE4|nr:nitroreductase family protein [Halanaerobium sp. MA284_MarDTE_T2]RCW47767.1 putative nitroreductase [Halanaerobium sp. MA284_MarDTE_T2]
MQIPVKRWYEAAEKRYSRKKYQKKEISKFTLRSYEKFLEELNQIFPEVRIKLFKEDISKLLPALEGKYGSITGAPYFIAIIVEKEGDYCWEKAGYAGEAALLEATDLGLATCWTAGRYKEEKSKVDLELEPDERLAAVSPLGFSSENYLFSQNFISKLFPRHDRKSLDDLCEGGFDSDWPGWMKNALKIARIAPSRLNRQPWRFKVESDRIIVECKGTPTAYRRLECGIALLHLEIGAKDGGVNGKVEFGGEGIGSFKKEH